MGQFAGGLGGWAPSHLFFSDGLLLEWNTFRSAIRPALSHQLFDLTPIGSAFATITQVCPAIETPQMYRYLLQIATQSL